MVRASYRLPAEAKHVWRIINEFDTKAGCWASMPLLAKLTGMPADVFEAHVGELAALGLVTRVEQGTKVLLFAALPNGFPDDAELERDDKLRCAERLDRLIAGELVRLNPRVIPHKDLAPNESSRTAVPLISSPAVTAVPSAGTPAKTAVPTTAPQGGSPDGSPPERPHRGEPAVPQSIAELLPPEMQAGFARYKARKAGLAT